MAYVLGWKRSVVETNIIGPAHSFGGGRGWLRLDPKGFLLLEWATGGTVTATDARAALEAVQQLTNGVSLPILIRINGNDVDPAAAALLRQTTLVCAVALVGETPVDKVIGAKMHRGRQQPHAFFMEEDRAAQWLLPLTAALTPAARVHVSPATSPGWLPSAHTALRP
jgi:hypothetical protein